MPLALEAVGVSKRWGAVTALDEAALSLRTGEVHALLGGGGSGRSTFCRILAGSLRPDAGAIRLHGDPVRIGGPRAAAALGLALCDRDLPMAPRLTVAEHLFLGHEPRRPGGAIDTAAREEATDLLIGRFAGVAGRLEARRRIGDLAPDERAIVGILTVLARKPRIAFFDEATAGLGRRQAEVFFSILKDLKAEGAAAVLVTHRLHEVFAVADRLTVLRDGRSVTTAEVAGTDPGAVMRAMLGEVRLGPRTRSRPRAEEGARLVVDGAAADGFGPVAFAAAPGEILGLGGRRGQGQRRLIDGLFGLRPFEAGAMAVDGVPVAPRTPRDAIRAGIGFVPGDRAGEGCLPGRSVLENAALAGLAAGRSPLVRARRLKQRFTRALAGLKARHPGLGAPFEALTGGTQQKVVLARWLALRPSVLLVDDIGRGVDLAARADLFAILRVLAETGTIIVVHAPDEADLLALCHRVLVFDGGRVVADLSGASLGAAALMGAALGEAA